MAKKSKSEKSAPPPNNRLIAENRRARFEYEILDSLECGIVLVGSEVKSLRQGKLSLEEAYGRIKDNEVWLVGAEIPEYKQATIWNHEPKRMRKLLLHRREVRKFAARAQEKGLTLVPLKAYFNERGVVKLVMGLCRGRKLHDKREVLKKRDTQRDIERAMRRR